MNNDTLFFDSSCPLCAHEIERLQSLCSAGIEFKDIHTLHEELAVNQYPGLPDKQALFDRLHCYTSENTWLVGAEANLRAWSHTSLKLWIKPLSWPGFLHIVKGFYEVWLIYYRFQRQRRRQCDACGEDKP